MKAARLSSCHLATRVLPTLSADQAVMFIRGGAFFLSTASVTNTTFLSNTATLGGALDIVLINGYRPNLGDTFSVLTCGSRTGTFATINGLINGLVYPRPIAWVSTLSAAGKPNLAPFSFFNAF